MQPIIIVTPPYIEQSNGIKTIHKICHTINQLGGDARLVFLNGGIGCGGVEHTNPNLNTPCLQESDRHLLLSSIVVYPEIVPGNPACASKIVRYLGNKDGLLNGRKMGAKDGDFLLAHSKVIEPNAHCVLFNAEFNPAFNDDCTVSWEERDFDATYVGKGYLYGECSIQPDTLLIERDWPRGAQQLAYILRRTRYFYTWDSWTATNIDAILCGAMPVFLRYDPWTEEELDGSELGSIPRFEARRILMRPSFREERGRLISRIKELSASWDERVAGFMKQVEAFW